MSIPAKEDNSITVEYDLYDLPTAQHKAGLAGLLLMIESLKMRKIAPIPEVKYDSTKASISFTRDTMQTLFNDLYDASWEEIESRTKWKGNAPKREVTRQSEGKDGKSKETKYYVYDQYIPKGEFLKSLYPVGNDLWLRLWRNMLWQTLRGRPLARKVYEDRADKKPSSEAEKLWNKLVKSVEYRSKGKILTESVVSSTFIGAQDTNAENVPFQGAVEYNLLLHFWTIASLVYVPRLIKKNDKSKKYELEEAGYVLAIPEPSSLKAFLEDLRCLLKSLPIEKSGYRPRYALITIPEEGGLEYLYHLAHSRVREKEIAYGLVAIEIYYLEKQGNNIRTLAAERILPDEQALSSYDKLREQYRNPLYKAERIKNLLSGEVWHTGMDSVFDRYPWEFFIFSSEKTPGGIPFFGYDARNNFDAIRQEFNFTKGGESMSQETADQRLALCVHRLTREYVNRRTEEKSKVKWEDFKNSKDDKGRIMYPPKYREQREKVCSDAFLAMRARRDKDFVEYFTGTVCSVPQFLPEEDYLVVSQELINRPDTVKTLSMLALSACSYLGGASDQQEGGKQ